MSRRVDGPGGRVASPAAALAPYLVRPRVEPPLDAGFRPIAVAREAARAAASRSRHAAPVTIGLERSGGLVDRREALVIEAGRPGAAATRILAERLVKAMLWSRGGHRIWVDGPPDLAAHLRRHYGATAVGRFDAATIAASVYGQPLEVVAAPAAEFPPVKETGLALGGHLDGCRIGFDLGASDRKVAAVIDGR
ncbi:MAG TPA: hypothetical protein VET90_05650, partial [Candidatus Binatus sp.]|nr:hypothetical protein [Candidatus Binatus sp.]